MKLKYLYRRPKSATEVMNIIKEAYDAFQEQQDINKKVKDKYEQELYANGIYESSEVKITSSGELHDHIGKIISIRKNIVVFQDHSNEEKKWKLRGFSFKRVDEIEKENQS